MSSCFRLIGAAAVLGLLSGCVSTSVYPDHWAKQVDPARGECPDVDGEYLNEGEYFEKVGDGGIVRHTVTLGALACAACTESERQAEGTLASVTEAYPRFRVELADETLAITASTGTTGSRNATSSRSARIAAVPCCRSKPAGGARSRKRTAGKPSAPRSACPCCRAPR